MQISFDEGRHSRAKLGFVLLATEQTIESDMFRLCPEGVGLHFTRATIPDSITVETLAAQADELAEAAGKILPDGSLDVITYACTSGSLVIGEDRIYQEFSKTQPQAKATCLIGSVMRALQAIGAKRIVVATPYLESINAAEKVYLEERGFDVLDIQGLDIEKDSDMIRVAPSFIEEFAFGLDCPEADALFISCGALRSIEIIESLETRIGKPVIVSNQAMMWDMLRLAGIKDKIQGYGQLFSNH